MERTDGCDRVQECRTQKSQLSDRTARMNVLVIDVGGTHVKTRVNGQNECRKFESGPGLGPGRMVLQVQKITSGWSYDVVSIGYPGLVLRNRPLADPCNLGH